MNRQILMQESAPTLGGAVARSAHSQQLGGKNQDGGQYIVEALARGLEILSLFSDEEPWLGLSEISRRTGHSTATCHRMLRTLQHFDFVEQAADTKKYRPSLAILRLGFSALAGQGLREVALPHLQRLSKELGETTNLGVLAGTEVVYIERIALTQLITNNIHVGSRLPVYASSIGKLLLAYLDPDRRESTLGSIAFERTGPNTITDRDLLAQQLNQIRERGYAIQDEELAAGLRSIAAPIRNSNGDVIAAINVAVSTIHVGVDVLEHAILPRLLIAAAEISATFRFGAGGEPKRRRTTEELAP